MESSDPFISVVIPTFNSEGSIRDTLESVCFQEYANLEIIVSDDESGDNTGEIVRKVFAENPQVRARLLNNSHVGPGENRNIGIRAAGGEWIAFLDSDDLWTKDKLAIVGRRIKEDPSVGLWCHSEVMRNGRREIALEHYKKFTPHTEQFISLYRYNSLSTSAVTVRKAALMRAGMFDGKLPAAQDFDLWLRLSMIVKIGYIRDTLGVYVVRDGNISSDPLRRLTCMLRIMHKYHDYLKSTTRLYLVEELRFRGRAFSGAGMGFIHRKKVVRGLFYLATGLVCWPFRIDGLQRIISGVKRHFFQTTDMSDKGGLQ